MANRTGKQAKVPQPSKRGGLVHQRIAAVREAIARGHDPKVIERRFAQEWGIAERTVRTYIMVVRDDVLNEFTSGKKQVTADVLLAMRKLYQTCVEKGELAAAWKYHQYMIQLFQLSAPQRVELTGKDGGPIEQVRKVNLSAASAEDLEALARVLGVDAKSTKGDGE